MPLNKAGSQAVSDLLERHFGQQLSKRELEIGRLAITGVPTQDIAERMFLAVNTVKTHLKHVFRKTGTENRNDLYRKLTALQFKVVEAQGPEGDGSPTRTASVLRKEAPLDPLTGALHSRGFRSLYEAAAAETRTNGTHLAVVRLYAEIRAESASELMLVALAGVLLTSIRKHDMMFRWADGEFVFLLPDCPVAGAQQIAARLVQRALALGDGRRMTVAVSAGVAGTEEGRTTADELLKAAGERAGAPGITHTHRVG